MMKHWNVYLFLQHYTEIHFITIFWYSSFTTFCLWPELKLNFILTFFRYRIPTFFLLFFFEHMCIGVYILLQSDEQTKNQYTFYFDFISFSSSFIMMMWLLGFSSFFENVCLPSYFFATHIWTTKKRNMRNITFKAIDDNVKKN